LKQHTKLSSETNKNSIFIKTFNLESCPNNTLCQGIPFGSRFFSFLRGGELNVRANLGLIINT